MIKIVKFAEVCICFTRRETSYVPMKKMAYCCLIIRNLTSCYDLGQKLVNEVVLVLTSQAASGDITAKH